MVQRAEELQSAIHNGLMVEFTEFALVGSTLSVGTLARLDGAAVCPATACCCSEQSGIDEQVGAV